MTFAIFGKREPVTNPRVYFDNAEGGIVRADGSLQRAFLDSLERISTVGPQPLTGPPILIENYDDKKWYLERDDSLIQIVTSPVFAGSHALAADPTPGSQPNRLSGAVKLVHQPQAIQNFLAQPGIGYAQTFMRFDAGLHNETIMFIDHEWLEGLQAPLHVAGGDWMAFVGVRPDGVVFVTAGTEATMNGTPSTERNWHLEVLGQSLQPNVQYRLRVVADFGARMFKSFSIVGPGLDRTFDLSALSLDYPNYMPFDRAAMGYFVGAMR